MSFEIVRVPGVQRPPGPWNHLVRANDLLFLTSQLACDLETNRILGGDIRQQTRQALENVRRLLEAGGSGLNRVVRVGVYLRRLEDFDGMNEVYRQYFEPGREPARVTVQAASPVENVDVEIEVVALAS